MEQGTHLDRITLVSGGQTGVDRATLDFCLDHGIRCGGWCPAGRKAEDGIIDRKYPLKELTQSSYKQRTAANVRDSDATVVVYFGEMWGGTLKSFEFIRKEKKHFLLLDMSVLDTTGAAERLGAFLDRYKPATVNVSGPRFSDWPEGYAMCYTVLGKTFNPTEPYTHPSRHQEPKSKTPSAQANGGRIL